MWSRTLKNEWGLTATAEQIRQHLRGLIAGKDAKRDPFRQMTKLFSTEYFNDPKFWELDLGKTTLLLLKNEVSIEVVHDPRNQNGEAKRDIQYIYRVYPPTSEELEQYLMNLPKNTKIYFDLMSGEIQSQIRDWKPRIWIVRCPPPKYSIPENFKAGQNGKISWVLLKKEPKRGTSAFIGQPDADFVVKREKEKVYDLRSANGNVKANSPQSTENQKQENGNGYGLRPRNGNGKVPSQKSNDKANTTPHQSTENQKQENGNGYGLRPRNGNGVTFTK
jgi:hypothetical protein